MDNNFNNSSFKEKLENETSFPALYMFKFIVPSGKEKEIQSLLPNNEMALKTSSKGKYVSATIKALMPDSQSIIDIYEKAAKIEGVIAL
jgi:putative lipoic acid-binding regulatory protein